VNPIPYTSDENHPDSPDYWEAIDTLYLNRLCFLAAVQFPSALTHFVIERYLLVINLPAAPAYIKYRELHSALLLQRIQRHTWVHANNI
jgi:hypothetical protein